MERPLMARKRPPAWCRWSTIIARSAWLYLARHLPQSRDIGQCSPASYGRGGVVRRASCQSCDRSEWLSIAASNECHRRLVLDRCYQPSDAPAGNIVESIGEGVHEAGSGRDIESRSFESLATKPRGRQPSAPLSRIARVGPSSFERLSLDPGSSRQSIFRRREV
jgi:hypothetical protein